MKTIFRRLTLVLISAFLTSTAGSRAASAPASISGQLSLQDYNFVLDAARGNFAEIKAGEMARTHASEARVKQFGERMETDHTKARDELKQIASKKGVTLIDDFATDGQMLINRLDQLRGAKFDQAYASAMVENHEKDLKAFQIAAKDSEDADVKAYAAKTESMVSQHLDAAKQMETAVKTADADSTSKSR